MSVCQPVDHCGPHWIFVPTFMGHRGWILLTGDSLTFRLLPSPDQNLNLSNVSASSSPSASDAEGTLLALLPFHQTSKSDGEGKRNSKESKKWTWERSSNPAHSLPVSTHRITARCGRECQIVGFGKSRKLSCRKGASSEAIQPFDKHFWWKYTEYGKHFTCQTSTCYYCLWWTIGCQRKKKKGQQLHVVPARRNMHLWVKESQSLF